MPYNKYNIIFPAFGAEYKGNELGILTELKSNLYIDNFLHIAHKTVGLDIESFKNCADGKFSDELMSQQSCYIYSCLFADILKDYLISISLYFL